MRQYLDLVFDVMQNGVDKGDRTGTGTRSVFGRQMRFDLSKGFPLVTTKFTPFKLIATELLWFIQGNRNISYLHKNNCHIWDEWVKEDGTFGPIYGKQWRSWPDYTELSKKKDSVFGELYSGFRKEIDQLQNVIDKIKTNPNDRRMIVSAWNVADVESGEMALPPCHVLFQFYVADNKLSCQLYQRSCDLFLGVPFNIASYALLTNMIALICDLDVGEFIWTGGDVHLYQNHFEQVQTLLMRQPLPLPELFITKDWEEEITIDDFELKDLKIFGYKHYPAIKAPIAV